MAMPLRARRPASGVTLMELMVALAIIAILARIAIPIYAGQAMESRRVDAKNALLDLAAREEKWFATNNVYTANFAQSGGLGYTGATSTTTAIALGSGSTSDYSMTISVTNSGANYAITATPVNQQANDGCGAYTLNDAGVQANQTVSSATAITGLNCW
jgi:type IV pilus assembly protein PilE